MERGAAGFGLPVVRTGARLKVPAVTTVGVAF